MSNAIAKPITSTGRFMIAEQWGDGLVVRGGAHPYTYKTFRGAAREIRKTRGAGVLLAWEPMLLPVVAVDEQLIADPPLADRMTELEFCDRQIQLWAAMADHVRSGERLQLAAKFGNDQHDLDDEDSRPS